jgi:uncharacterized protein DUF11
MGENQSTVPARCPARGYLPGQGAMFLGALTAALTVVALVAAPAFGANSISQTGSPGVVKKGSDATYMVTVTNGGSSQEENTLVQMGSGEPGSSTPTSNIYKSVQPTQGSCEVPYPYLANCELGTLAPGQTVQITAVSTIYEPADHRAALVPCFVAYICGGPAPGDLVTVRTLVDAPPEIEGSKKIKLKRLPSACAERDFKFTATAKGAKKIVAKWTGPHDADGGQDPDDPKQGGKFAAKGRKLKATFPAGKVEPGFYEIKLAAKYEGKPKQKTRVFLQRCGDAGP